MKSKEVVIGIVIVLVLIGIGVFFFRGGDGKSNVEVQGFESLKSNFQWSQIGSWGDVELKDVRTGENFKINDFSGKPILLESFAVWCPTCTRQQNIIKDYHKEVGNAVISISLDTDQNEDEERIRQHIDSNGFNWYYAVSPIELTKTLIDEFGVGIVNAPSVPMLIICENGDVRKLDNGIKKIDELRNAVASCQ